MNSLTIKKKFVIIVRNLTINILEVDMEEDVCIVIRNTSAMIRRRIDSCISDAPVSGIRGFILKFLVDSSGKDIYQKDLEKQFGVRRSTMSAFLDNLESCELIERKAVTHDARLKRIAITEKGRAAEAEIHRTVLKICDELLAGIDESRLAVMVDTLKKIMENAK